MKTYIVPTPNHELLEITEQDNPEAFKNMQRAEMEMIPTHQAAHLVFYETFHVMNMNSRKEFDLNEMMQAGIYLGHWLDIQTARFEAEKKESK